ncbi:MAG TPA: hypothetical protein VNA67_06435 [Pseudonocardiaceae bacterium]|nr:hypothetical protein [Pseudonocardiaceae bacterium]
MSVVIVIGFAAFGLFAGLQLWGLAGLHRGLLDAATGLETTGRAIAVLAKVPLVGDDAQQQADNVARTASQIRTGALGARDSVQVLAVVVGVAIALLAVVPVGVLYLPLRLARRRELSELQRMLSGPDQPMLIEYLARTTVRRTPYRDLRRISQHPWRDLEQGDHAHLAAAELRRLGLPPPREWSPPEPERNPA